MKKYMHDMSDKELDDFFKQAAQQYEAPYDPADWQKMKGRLDRNGFAGNWKKWMGRGLYLVFFLFLFSGTSQVNVSQNQPEIKTNEVGIISEEANSGHTSRPADVSPRLEVNESETKAQKEPQPSTAFTEENTKDESKQQVEQTSATDHSRPPSQAFSLSEEEEPTYQASFIYPERVSLLSYLPPYYSQRNGTLPSVEKVAIYEINDTAKQSPEEVIRPKKRPLLSFSVMLAPDISAVKAREVNGVGRAAGINIEYFPLPNLSINTGAVYAYKLYEVGEGSFRSYGGSSGYRKLKSIDGNCRVLDIPINLRFYAINREKSRWYASTGISSYFMLTEDYEYKYENTVDDKYRFHNYRNENQHYFSVLNLSVGYERRVGNHWALQLEPYAKVPLAGVGAGKIRLNSTGFFITLKYVL